MADKKLTFSITAENNTNAAINEATANLEKVEKKTADVTKAQTAQASASTKSGGAFSSLSGAVASGMLIYNAAVMAVEKFIGAIKGTVDAYVEAEKKTALMENRLKNMGAEYGALIPKVKEHADQMIQMGFDDEETADSLSRLIQMTGDYNSAVQIQNVAMDFARNKGISLDQATQTLIKANVSGARVMREFGSTLEDNATFMQVLMEIEKNAGNATETYANQTAGQLDVMSVKWDNLKEKIGGVFVTLAGYVKTGMIASMEAWGMSLTDTKVVIDRNLASIDAKFKTSAVAQKEFADAVNSAHEEVTNALQKERDDLEKNAQDWTTTRQKMADDLTKLQKDFLANEKDTEEANHERQLELYNSHAEKVANLKEQVATEEDQTKKDKLQKQLDEELAILRQYDGLKTEAQALASKSDLQLLDERFKAEKQKRIDAAAEKVADMQKEYLAEQEAYKKKDEAILNATATTLQKIQDKYKVSFGNIKTIVDTTHDQIATSIADIVSQFMQAEVKVSTAAASIKAKAQEATVAKESLVSFNSLGIMQIGTQTNKSTDPLSFLPHFAEGGIVNGPTIALIGEDGPEEVVPLGKGTRSGLTINLTITGNNFVGREGIADQIGRDVMRVIKANVKL
jgi:hypothetical protein